VREKILHRMREEIPHAAAVVSIAGSRAPTARRDRRDDLRRAGLAEGIVIGKGGGVLKEVGAEARADIERLIEHRVFLSLRVEVRPDWRNDPRVLGELGIG
jgi:GTP-binding protein Era